jgi:hypothetical protein
MAINARDAMVDGGKLVLRTKPVFSMKPNAKPISTRNQGHMCFFRSATQAWV